MKIIHKPRTITIRNVDRFFHHPDNTGWGFAFPCHKDGTPITFRCKEAEENFRKCLDGTHNVIDAGVRITEYSVRERAVGECDLCKRDVYLDSFTNTCDCGADYNMSGQRLAPREQWGEETGEHWSECY
jgi:hypothetical protein